MSHRCCHLESDQNKHEEQVRWYLQYWNALLSALLLLIGIALNHFYAHSFFQGLWAFGWYLVAYLPVGVPIWKEAWKSILEKDIFSEFTLMTVATLGAFYIGEYPEAVAVMLFYAVGEAFQEKAIYRAQRNIGQLLDVRPERVTLVRDGVAEEVAPASVIVGDVIEVKAGGRVPLDGTMQTEKASFDTVALTGESIPRTYHRGDEVLAGMIVCDRLIRITVTKPYNQSTLARILELVQHAAERKAPAELFIRKFARIYTPVMLSLALCIVVCPWLMSIFVSSSVYVFDTWFYRALIFLVISCPCALVVSIPLSYFGGIGAASRMGVLFKGGNYLDSITQINTVVFDKTGTLTQGVFEVQAVSTISEITTDKMLSQMAGVEFYSTHPIAKAILRYAEKLQVEITKFDDVKEIAGYGLQAWLGKDEYLFGNLRLLDLFGVTYPKALCALSETVVVGAKNSRYEGYLVLSDTLKEDALQAVRLLQKEGIDNIVILSGDKQTIVNEFAQRLGISKAYGDLLPEDKVKYIERLKQKGKNKVIFVGDGMNDAPVLALSDVGIAMGGLGSDAAIETADVVIQTDQPSKVATAVQVGRATRHILWQNIMMVFCIKIFVLILGIGGLATMWEAVFADVGVALIAIVNAVRIQKLIK